MYQSFPSMSAQSKGQNTGSDAEILGCFHTTITCLSHDLGSVQYTKSSALVVESPVQTLGLPYTGYII